MNLKNLPSLSHILSPLCLFLHESSVPQQYSFPWCPQLFSAHMTGAYLGHFFLPPLQHPHLPTLFLILQLVPSLQSRTSSVSVGVNQGHDESFATNIEIFYLGECNFALIILVAVDARHKNDNLPLLEWLDSPSVESLAVVGILEVPKIYNV